MDLVLFQQVLKYVLRITRILNMPKCNKMFFIGMGGSRKQSLLKLAAFIKSIDIEQLIITASITMKNLRNQLPEI